MLYASSSPRALVRSDSGVRLEARQRPHLGGGQARVAIRVAGICRTDLYAADGRLPVKPGRVLGHEACGEVLEAYAEGLPTGTRVAILPLCPCGTCAGCAAGRRCVSPELLGVDRDGLFADEVVVPAHALLPVPASLDDRHAACVEPVAAALAVRDAALPLDEPGVIVGGGRIAELVRRVLVSLGARRVVLCEPRGEQRDQFAWAVETLPTAAALDWAVSAVRPGGIVVLKSRPAQPLALDVARVVKKRLTLRGVDYAPFEHALRWLVEHDLGELFSEPLPLERHEEAFARARNGETRKVFLRCKA